MSYCNGSDLLLYIGADASKKAIGHCTSHTVTYASETKDRAVKPLASAAISAGLWKDKAVTGLSISIKADGLVFLDETEMGYDALASLWKAGSTVTATCMLREETSPYLVGTFVITNLEQTAAAGDDATYSISLENSGAPTVFETSKLTPSTT